MMREVFTQEYETPTSPEKNFTSCLELRVYFVFSSEANTEEIAQKRRFFLYLPHFMVHPLSNRLFFTFHYFCPVASTIDRCIKIALSNFRQFIACCAAARVHFSGYCCISVILEHIFHVDDQTLCSCFHVCILH